MTYTEEMTTSEILLRLASMRNELLQAVNDIEKISKNICYKAEQTEPQMDIHDLTDCDFCKDRNCKDCEGGKDEPQKETADDLQLFVDILFDKDKTAQFLEECKAMGIEP